MQCSLLYLLLSVIMTFELGSGLRPCSFVTQAFGQLSDSNNFKLYKPEKDSYHIFYVCISPSRQSAKSLFFFHSKLKTDVMYTCLKVFF